MAVKFKPLSAKVLAGRGRRGKAADRRAVRMQWFIKEVSDKVAITIKGRMMLATELVKSKVVRNISRPVTKTKGPRGGTIVTNRSKPGEFPKADTTQLMKTIFGEVKQTVPGIWDGFVGTPLNYGLILETKMNRSFLVRTLNEQRITVMKILSGPIK